MQRIVAALSIFAAVALILLYWMSGFQASQRQYDVWTNWAPEALLPQLIESDDFGANRYIKSIESSNLFSSFHLYDLTQRMVGGFGPNLSDDRIPIKDKAGTTWGYVSYHRNYGELISSALLAAGILAVFIALALYLGFGNINTQIARELDPLDHLIDEVAQIFDRLATLPVDVTPDRLLPTNKGYSLQESKISELFAKVVSEIVSYRDKIERMTIEREAVNRQKEFNELARQVAHDIRSPLSALHILMTVLKKDLPQKQFNLFSGAVARITEISDDLVTTGLGNKKSMLLNEQNAATLLRSIVNEKTLEFSTKTKLSVSLAMDDSVQKAFVVVNPTEFKRVISNLMNNSAEALQYNGKITVQLKSDNARNVALEIVDDGPGFPQSLLEQPFEKGRSMNKANGSGLGLYHASNEIAKWNGSLEAYNNEPQGAGVRIRLPICREEMKDV